MFLHVGNYFPSRGTHQQSDQNKLRRSLYLNQVMNLPDVALRFSCLLRFFVTSTQVLINFVYLGQKVQACFDGKPLLKCRKIELTSFIYD